MMRCRAELDGRFSRRARGQYEAARLFVERIPDDFEPLVRCHELARAVAKLLGPSVEVQDGHAGFVEHSWLWLEHHHVILDVYFPGAKPQVLLIDYLSVGSPFRAIYRPGAPRQDIRQRDVARLYQLGWAPPSRPFEPVCPSPHRI